MKYGLVVDRFLSEVEVLVKPLTGGLEEMQGVSRRGHHGRRAGGACAQCAGVPQHGSNRMQLAVPATSAANSPRSRGGKRGEKRGEKLGLPGLPHTGEATGRTRTTRGNHGECTGEGERCDSEFFLRADLRGSAVSCFWFVSRSPLIPRRHRPHGRWETRGSLGALFGGPLEHQGAQSRHGAGANPLTLLVDGELAGGEILQAE